MALTAYAMRVPVYRLKLFLGPSLIRLRLAQHRLDIGCIPYGGWLEHWAPDATDEQRETVLPFWGLFAVGLACAIPQLSIGVAALGWREALTSGVNGLWQLWAGGFHFWGTGVALLRDGQAVTENDGFAGVLGHTAMKFGVMMLLPMPILNFGFILQRLFFMRQEVAWHLTSMINFLCFVLMCLGWLIAAVIACVQDLTL